MSQDVLLETQQLLAPCPSHLPTRVHVLSLLRLNPRSSALCHSTPGHLFYKTVPTDLSILHVHESASLASLGSCEGRMKKCVLHIWYFLLLNALQVSDSLFTGSGHHAFAYAGPTSQNAFHMHFHLLKT